mmetsp:Transcript_37604/g.94328  ORF Transcript_37604/g.94328 Transcript_37604/m.94328 type:complete len:289 (+) Transcript_37604:3577-4443(+)
MGAQRPQRMVTHQRCGQPADDDRRRLEVDPLVFDAHEHDPPERVLGDGHLQRLVGADHLHHQRSHLLPVLQDALDEQRCRLGVLVGLLLGRPGVVGLVEVVPGHLVDTHCTHRLQLWVDSLCDVFAEDEFVDEEARRVAEVEDEWVAQRLGLDEIALGAAHDIKQLFVEVECLREVSLDLHALVCRTAAIHNHSLCAEKTVVRRHAARLRLLAAARGARHRVCRLSSVSGTHTHSPVSGEENQHTNGKIARTRPDERTQKPKRRAPVCFSVCLSDSLSLGYTQQYAAK